MPLIKKYDAGTIIFKENDRCRYVGKVKKGEVKILSFSYFGNEMIYRTISENGYFGNNLIFSSSPFYLGNIVSVSPSEIIFYSREEFLSLLKEDSTLLEEYLIAQAEISKKLNQKIKILSLSSAEERLFYLLSVFSGRYHYDTMSGLASALFLSRESASRTVHELERKNKIKINNKTIYKI